MKPINWKILSLSQVGLILCAYGSLGLAFSSGWTSSGDIGGHPILILSSPTLWYLGLISNTVGFMLMIWDTRKKD